MAESTETTVRNTIVSALEAIAQSGLGFDCVSGKIWPYLLNWERDEQKVNYLMSEINGASQVRAWGVQVLSSESLDIGGGTITRRTYSILVRGYYEFGFNGSGINALIDGSRKVREAIKNLGVRLSGTVDTIEAAGTLILEELSGEDVAGGRLITGSLNYTATRGNPDY